MNIVMVKTLYNTCWSCYLPEDALTSNPVKTFADLRRPGSFVPQQSCLWYTHKVYSTHTHTHTHMHVEFVSTCSRPAKTFTHLVPEANVYIMMILCDV